MKPLTKNRAELLRLFFTNPDRSFYMREIGRILGKEPGAFQRTLNNLVREEIVSSEYRANARFFQVNKSYPLYAELKSIVFKTVGAAGAIRSRLRNLKGIRFAFIYGSYAKGKEDALSDIDILIIGNINEDELIKRLDKLEKALQREINYKLYLPAEFRDLIRRKDAFVSSLLKSKKILLIGEDSELQDFAAAETA